MPKPKIATARKNSVLIFYHSHSSKYTEREIKQLDFLSQFDLDFRHVRGADNEVADALSGIEINSFQFPSGIDCTELAAEQREGIGSHGIPILITLLFGDNTRVGCNRSSHWPAATKETISLAFMQNWIAQLGEPKSVTNDRGSRFFRYFPNCATFWVASESEQTLITQVRTEWSNAYIGN